MCNLCCKLMQTLERASPGCKVHERIDYGAIRVAQVVPGTVADGLSSFIQLAHGILCECAAAICGISRV